MSILWTNGLAFADHTWRSHVYLILLSALQTDEEPLYVFDNDFGRDAPALLHDYAVPCVFDQDYFSLLGG